MFRFAVKDVRACICIIKNKNMKKYSIFNSYRGTELNDRDYSLADNMSMRPKLRVQDLLSVMEPKIFTISENASVLDAITHVVTQEIASTLATDKNGEIVGIFTCRDLLKSVQTQSLLREGRHRWAYSLTEVKVRDIMTPKQHLVYCSPKDSASRCREIMFQCKIRNLPVIENGEVLGIITAKLLADSSFNLQEIGGKKGFIHNVTGRKGLPEGTKINQAALEKRYCGQHQLNSAIAQFVDLEIGSFALPHPFKKSEGVAMSRRLYGAQELSDDLNLCEDAHFVLKIEDPSESENENAVTTSSDADITNKEKVDEDAALLNSVLSVANMAHSDSTSLPLSSSSTALITAATSTTATAAATHNVRRQQSHVYLCVADGVGSWRQYGIDPRAYSHRLVENAKKVIESDISHRELLGHSFFDREEMDPVHPLDVILDAWNMTNNEGIVGSSTICVATLNKKLSQLSYSNIGDCGLLVVRHIDSETAGYMMSHERSSASSLLPKKHSHLKPNDLRIAYLSQQQLRSFNLPYQLGNSSNNITTNSSSSASSNNTINTQMPSNFESPADADTASIPVMPGDIIILATDGLFDNLDLDEIVDEVSIWEQNYLNNGSNCNPINNSSSNGNTPVQILAEQLVRIARERSLDKHRDSPFAILAKENDIMWGGGMPDDTTVVVARVVVLPYNKQ